MAEKRKIWHWIVLAILSLIWGTSYILMKKGLESFSSLQVGSLRILITFICLLPIAIRNLHHLNRTNILSIIIIGLFGSVFPAFLFPLAETKISSSLAGMLNSLSPVFGATVIYFIPIVATLWGLADNEHFSSSMLISVVFIFAGVYIINRPDFFKKRRVISDE